MLTLTLASKDTKLIIKWLVLIIGIIIVIFLLIGLVTRLKDTFFPTPPPLPTVAFGKIALPTFPRKQISIKKFSVDTISGFLPSLPTQLNVYTVIKSKPDLLSLDKINTRIATQNFTDGPHKISDTYYYWTDNSTDLLKTIKINIVTYDFNMTSNFYPNTDIQKGINVPNENDAKDFAANFLSSMNYFSDQIDQAKTTTTTFSIQNQALTEASSFSNTQLIRVDFFQKDIDNLPIFYEKPNQSNINLLITGGKQEQVVEANYVLQIPGPDSSTYPIKTAAEAFKDLQKGNAYIASYYGNGNNVSIKNVYLAYYISTTPQNYLIPVIVFEGNDGFFAYDTAVTDEWISK